MEGGLPAAVSSGSGINGKKLTTILTTNYVPSRKIATIIATKIATKIGEFYARIVNSLPFGFEQFCRKKSQKPLISQWFRGFFYGDPPEIYPFGA